MDGDVGTGRSEPPAGLVDHRRAGVDRGHPEASATEGDDVQTDPTGGVEDPGPSGETVKGGAYARRGGAESELRVVVEPVVVVGELAVPALTRPGLSCRGSWPWLR